MKGIIESGVNGMSYKALYLTYRPQTFDEVAGQSAIVRTLKNAIATDKIAHAYLFAGPRGTGKTTMARLFAKALDCEDGVGHQCNRCPNCQAITEGIHPDVIEIDAASNNGVDQVRDLIDKVKYAPIKGRYKVYIIDEVHMMSAGAFNALLKTLEEPPDNVVFILCTTEPYKVLPTILSRCQRFDFRKLTDEEMEGKLKEVLLSEKTEYDEAALKAIIKLADGGMRDALSILDQVLAYAGNKLRMDDVLDIYGLASMDEKIDLLLSVKKGDVARVVGKSEAYLASGLDIRRLISDLLAILKDLLIYEKTKEASLLEELAPTQASAMAEEIPPQDCDAMISKLIEAQNDFKNVSDIRSLFELTLLRMASAGGPSLPPQAAKAAQAPLPKTEKAEQAMAPSPIIQPAPAAPTAAPLISASPISSPKEMPSMQPSPSKKPDRMPSAPAGQTVAPESHAPSAAPAPAAQKGGPVIPPITDEAKPAKENPPAFLFEDEEPPKTEPTPKRTSRSRETSSIPALKQTITSDLGGVTNAAIASSGTQFSLPDEEIIKIMVLADKKERTALADQWDRFNDLKADPKLGNLATLLADGHPYCLCKEAIILSYNFTRLRNKANIVANQEPLQQLLAMILGRRVFIYAIDPNDRNRIMTEFFNLQSVNKLPKKTEITLNLPK